MTLQHLCPGTVAHKAGLGEQDTCPHDHGRDVVTLTGTWLLEDFGVEFLETVSASTLGDATTHTSYKTESGVDFLKIYGGGGKKISF